MDVISFPSWRVFFYWDGTGENVIRRWLSEQGVSSPDRNALQSLIDICEYSGPKALSYCTSELGEGFYSLHSKRKGGVELSPVFYVGPFSDSEITFLAGAQIEKNALKPRYARAIAEENLEELRREPNRRRREPVT